METILLTIIPGFLAMVTAIFAWLKGERDRRRTDAAASVMQASITAYEHTTLELRQQVVFLKAEVHDLTIQEEVRKKQLHHLHEEIVKCESESARTQVRATQLDAEVQIVKATNVTLIARIANLQNDIDQLTNIIKVRGLR